MSVLPEPPTDQMDLVTVLAALADPARLAAIRLIDREGETHCGAVPDIAGLSIGKSTLSHHLRVLREAGITRTRLVGSRRYVSLRRDDVEARFPGLLNAVLNAEIPAKAVP